MICDGASSNLTLLKMLVGRRGSLGYNEAQGDKHAIPASFTNPFSGDKVFVIICPSHQVSKSRHFKCIVNIKSITFTTYSSSQ